MTTIDRSVLVPYTPAQMFSIANNVLAYPEFLPWVTATGLVSETETEMVAWLEITRAGMSQRLSTHNTLERPEYIHLELLEGPFRYLSGTWHFTDLAGVGCKVHFVMTFEVDNRFLKMALGRFSGGVVDTLVAAFCDRADQLYG
ncbi:MAG: type II toxin-antitoxin system RatA family toxin [Pseudomonadota bacterium]